MKPKPYAVLLGELLLTNEVLRWQFVVMESQNKMLDKGIKMTHEALDASDKALETLEEYKWLAKTFNSVERPIQ